MADSKLSTAQKILLFSAVTEIATGITLLIAPAMLITLLWRAETSEVTALVGRCFGVALVALGLACWQKRGGSAVGSPALRAMFTYNALIALLLTYVGAVVHLSGPLLWPAVAIHAAVALLVWART